MNENSMSYRSTWKNRYFGASFMSVGGVEADRDIDVLEYLKSPFLGHQYPNNII